MKINEQKAIAGIDSYHNVAEHFVTKCGELSQHATDRMAFTVSSVATITVAVTSVIPEGMAVAESSGSAWLGVATASASVAGVFVAMKRPVVWCVYAAQLLLSLSLVRAHGGGVLMLYPLVSCFGALIAAFGVDAVEQRVADSKVEQRVDLDAELDREIRLMRERNKIENSKVRTAAKYGLGNDEKTTNSRPSKADTLVDDDKREKSAKVRSKKARARLDAMHEFVLSEYAGTAVKDITATEIKRKMGLTVSDSTVRNDFKELRQSRLNGKVPA